MELSDLLCMYSIKYNEGEVQSLVKACSLCEVIIMQEHLSQVSNLGSAA